MTKPRANPADHIFPLEINNLTGRMLKLPAPRGKKREILLIAGQHTSLERVFGMAEYLNRYGAVTSPDLPGFGGMEAFYKIGEKPTLQRLADYLAAFIKLRYKNKRVSIVAVSFGFTVVTRMLQKYPEISKKVNLLISVSGYVHKDDFRWKKSSIALLGGTALLLSFRPMAFLTRKLIIRSPVIRFLYRLADSRHPKLKDSSPLKRAELVDYEINLWKINDLRTYGYVGSRGFLMKPTAERVSLDVYHVAVDDDHYFSSIAVEQHMRQIFSDFIAVKSGLKTHAPTVLASAREVAPLIPPKLRALLRNDP